MYNKHPLLRVTIQRNGEDLVVYLLLDDADYSCMPLGRYLVRNALCDFISRIYPDYEYIDGFSQIEPSEVPDGTEVPKVSDYDGFRHAGY